MPPVVVMGVSGVGKTTLMHALAQRLGIEAVDADDLHPAANREKMAAGVPLTDADRAPWLAAVAARLAEAVAMKHGVVLACSALRRTYRDQLRAAAPTIRLVHLVAAEPLLHARMQARDGHFMPVSLLASQLAALEPPAPDEQALHLPADAELSALVDAVTAWLAADP